MAQQPKTYFDCNTDDLADSGITGTLQAEVPEYAPTQMTVSGKAAGISFYGASLLYHTKTAVRMYFKTNGDISNYAFTVNNTVCTPVEKNGCWYVDIQDINPDALQNIVSVDVSDGTNTMTVVYNPMNYIVRMYHTSGDDSLRLLLKAMYNYYLAACEYV
jgi:hypothetical protein